MRICVCILNYNNGGKTVKCLESVMNQTFHEHRVIVIDNRSTDDSLAVIKSYIRETGIPVVSLSGNQLNDDLTGDLPAVTLIESEVNGGYSYGNNLGIRLAKRCGIFTNILIINNDLVLQPDFLAEAAVTYESLRRKNHTDKIALGAVEFDLNGRITHRGFHYLHIPTGFPLPFSLFPSFRYIVGSCIFIDINAPLMDESFFLYFDDIQYSKILVRNGYKLDVSEASHYVHEVGGTTRKDLRMYKVVYKSLKRFYRLNYPLFLPTAAIFEMSANIIRSRIRYLLARH